MNREKWAQVKDLFDQARSLPPTQRSEFLSDCAADPDVLQEVSSLLAVYEESPEFLEQPPPMPQAGPSPESLPGRRLGPWRLLREIGHGGMGVVWEGERADGEYQQRVAVKLLGGFASQSGIARFREERRILALLEHPSIARLLDGGAAPDGTPYLVMEFVDGVPLDAWLQRNNPPVSERLALFIRICDAVDYAHRRLVIHRDLKPANVLITADGSPKLLDFGIAKFLSPDAGISLEVTQPTERILTPGFASPEQVRGEPAGTGTDVYSLGVLLYLLLTGRNPYVSDPRDPLQAIRAVLEQDPPPPSAVVPEAARQLRGGLDAVVQLAMRKSPDERYPSVRALADDLRAWLDGRPVQAHPESRLSKARKFVRRNRTISLAVTLTAMSILAGSAVSLWMAHTARTERARAENSFREVRQFSRSVLFELNDAIRNLPGSTPARLLLLRRSTEMLDNLARTSAGDVTLQLELVEGYRRLGHIQGSAFSDNIGQVDEAIESFRKAVRLSENALAASPNHPEAAAALLRSYEDLADSLLTRNPSEADSIYAKHRTLVDELDRRPRQNPKTRYAVATGYSALGFHHIQRNRLAEAKTDFHKAVERLESLAPSQSELPDLQPQYAFALKRLGAILIREDSLEQAEQVYKRALESENAALTATPADRRKILDRTMTLSDLALIQKKRNNLPESARIYQELIEIRRAALHVDPRNQRLLKLTVSAELNLSAVHSLAGRHLEAVELATSALRRHLQARRQADIPEWEVASTFLSLAERLVDAAEHASPSERTRLLREARACLNTAASGISKIPPDARSAVQQSAWDQVLNLRRRLEPTSPPANLAR